MGLGRALRRELILRSVSIKHELTDAIGGPTFLDFLQAPWNRPEPLHKAIKTALIRAKLRKLKKRGVKGFKKVLPAILGGVGSGTVYAAVTAKRRDKPMEVVMVDKKSGLGGMAKLRELIAARIAKGGNIKDLTKGLDPAVVKRLVSACGARGKELTAKHGTKAAAALVGKRLGTSAKGFLSRHKVPIGAGLGTGVGASLLMDKASGMSVPESPAGVGTKPTRSPGRTRIKDAVAPATGRPSAIRTAGTAEQTEMTPKGRNTKMAISGVAKVASIPVKHAVLNGTFEAGDSPHGSSMSARRLAGVLIDDFAEQYIPTNAPASDETVAQLVRRGR